MNNREKCIALINSFNENQLEYVAKMLAVFKDAIDDAEDEGFCEKMYQDYLNAPDSEKGDWIQIEEVAKELGIELADNK